MLNMKNWVKVIKETVDEEKGKEKKLRQKWRYLYSPSTKLVDLLKHQKQ